MTPFRIGHGYDVHALGPDLPLWLGGVRIPHTHLCDALLGAAALGDIGTHFPDTSEEFRNIDSKILLRRTVALLTTEGYAVGNVDCTLCMQRPKIKPYIPAMRQALSEAMHLPVEAISIKATTTEHLGFTGREEGVEAHAVALLYRLP